MKYEVIRYFTDAQDNEYAYREGDIYPREGLTVSQARINDLMSGNNFQKVALIKPFDESQKPVKAKEENPKEEIPEEVKESEFSAEEIDKMPFMKLKAVAKKNGIPVENREAKDIREDVKKELGV